MHGVGVLDSVRSLALPAGVLAATQALVMCLFPAEIAGVYRFADGLRSHYRLASSGTGQPLSDRSADASHSCAGSISIPMKASSSASHTRVRANRATSAGVWAGPCGASA